MDISTTLEALSYIINQTITSNKECKIKLNVFLNIIVLRHTRILFCFISEKTSSLIKCCPFCDYTHESENNIRGHAESHSAVFSCVMCDVETCKPDDLQNHYKKTHMKLLKQLPREEPTEHSCSFCARVFKKQAQLTLHLRIHKQREIVGCPNCDYKGPKNKMKAHALKYHHPTKYVCEICGKDFGSVGAAKFHMTSVHEGTLYSCPVCDKKFSTDRFRKVSFYWASAKFWFNAYCRHVARPSLCPAARPLCMSFHSLLAKL